MSKDILGLHVNTHIVSLEVHALIGHITILVAVDHIVLGVEDHRVLRLTLDDVRKSCTGGASTLLCSVALCWVHCSTISGLEKTECSRSGARDAEREANKHCKQQC